MHRSALTLRYHAIRQQKATSSPSSFFPMHLEIWNNIQKSPIEIRKIFSSRIGLFRGTLILLFCLSLLLFIFSAPKVNHSFDFEDGFESRFSFWDGISPPLKEEGSPLTPGNQIHHGMYSASFSSDPTQNNRSYVYHRVEPASTNLYARGYFYISKSGLTYNGSHSALITFRAGNDTVAYAGWRNDSGPLKWYLTIWNGSGHEVIPSSFSASTSKWYSVELHWREGLTSSMVEMWVEGHFACSSGERYTSGSGGVDTVRIGLCETATGGPTIVYTDCVVLNESGIGLETDESGISESRIWFLVIGTVSAGIFVATFLANRRRARTGVSMSQDGETVIY